MNAIVESVLVIDVMIVKLEASQRLFPDVLTGNEGGSMSKETSKGSLNQVLHSQPTARACLPGSPAAVQSSGH